MRKFLLPIELYFDVHPILELDSINKINYIEILKSILEPNFLNNEWKKQLFKLYKSKFGLEIKTNSISIKEIPHKYFKFRYWLLVDSLFIAGFIDKIVGKKILNRCKEIYRPVMFYRVEEFDYIYNSFYADNKPDDFFDKYPFWDNIKDYYYCLFGTVEQCISKKQLKKEFDICINNIYSLLTKKKKQKKKVFDVFNIIWKNRRFLAQKERNIIVTGTMSAGKSTFINALIGKKVAKTKNGSCTKKNHFIHNKSGEDCFTYKYDNYLTLDATNEDLLVNNLENESNNISIATRFRLFTTINDRLCIIDTPGVNSDKDIDHKDIAQKIIKMEHQKEDLMIYLINGSAPLTTDDKQH